MNDLIGYTKETTKIALSSILKGSEYDLSIFTNDEIAWFEERIYLKNEKPYVECISRGKEIQLKPEEPEEVVRQLFTKKLIDQYGYKGRIKFEHSVQFGRETKSADIVVFDKDRPTVEYIIVEVKNQNLKTVKNNSSHTAMLLELRSVYGQMAVRFPTITEKVVFITLIYSLAP